MLRLSLSVDDPERTLAGQQRVTHRCARRRGGGMAARGAGAAGKRVRRIGGGVKEKER